MHPSTIAAILAFTAGMPASAAPANRGVDPYAGLGHIAVMPTTKEQADLFNKLDGRATRGSRVGKALEGAGGAVGAVADFLTIGQAAQGAQQNAKRDPQRRRVCSITASAAAREACEEALRPQLGIPSAELQLGVRKVARGNRMGDAAGEIAHGVGPVADLFNSQQKRDAQRGRNFGKFLKGAGEGVGTFVDLVNIGGAIGGQPAQKREAQRGRFGNTCLTTPCAGIMPPPLSGVVQKQEEETQPSEKQDAQRSRGKAFGKADILWTRPLEQSGGDIPLPEKREAEPIGGRTQGRCPITGCRDDLLHIGILPLPEKREAQINHIQKSKGRCQGFPSCRDDLLHINLPTIPKRDAQRSKGKIIGNIVKGVGGVIGGVADTATIVGAVQGQGQPAQ
ncbi:hypothetical protein Ptr902_03744 [Pyrenophora tritici-repentis]|nr:hypothetical protein L13192_12048 [Pyrenophora tritici-repentis]KAI2484804.1 hypothetical protein Ptr902_03744 [Pyrenophora tritici-repentis]